jgi:membrane protease YdiL (CAAX protease family)
LEQTASTAGAQGPGISAKPWGLLAVLGGVALPLLLWAGSVAIATVEDTPDDLSEGQIVAGLVFTIILDFALIGLAAGFSLWRYKLGWAELGLKPFDRNLWWLPLVAAGAAHVAIITYAVVLQLAGADAAVPEQEDLDQLFESRAVLPLTALATVIMAPLAEELFFRGFVFAGLLRPFGVPGAMVASGLLFGAFHITGPETVGLVLPFGAVGVLFAWLYWRTGSVWPSIATHLVFNLVSFVALAAAAGST